jgi:hypothetical protein
MKTWLHVLSFRGILPNRKLTKVLRIVGSGNGLEQLVDGNPVGQFIRKIDS